MGKGLDDSCKYNERRPRALAPAQQIKALQSKVEVLQTKLREAGIEGSEIEELVRTESGDGSGQSDREAVSQSPVSEAVSQQPMHLPDEHIIGYLYSVFENELGPIVFLYPAGSLPGTVPAAFRYAAAALAARYLGGTYEVAGASLSIAASSTIEPMLQGKMMPTVEACHICLLLAYYFAYGSDVGDLEEAQRTVARLGVLLRELGLVDELEMFRPRTRQLTPGPFSSLELNRRLFWSLWTMEQDTAVMSFRHASFRNSEISVGLPWTAVPGSVPITLSALDSGIEPFESSPHARRIYLRYIVRRLVDYSADYHRANVAIGGNHFVPTRTSAERIWILDSLKSWLTAEVRYIADPAAPGDDILLSPVKGSLASNGVLPHLPMGPKLKSITKSLIFHSLSALVSCPRIDAVNFLTPDPNGARPGEIWQAAARRLRTWIALPQMARPPSGLFDPANDSEIALQSAAETTTTCYQHILAASQLVQDLLPFGNQITFMSPFAAWCVLSVASIDLIWLALGDGNEQTQAHARSGLFSLLFRNPILLHGWPIMSTLAVGYELLHRQAMAYRSALLGGQAAMT